MKIKEKQLQDLLNSFEYLYSKAEDLERKLSANIEIFPRKKAFLKRFDGNLPDIDTFMNIYKIAENGRQTLLSKQEKESGKANYESLISESVGNLLVYIYNEIRAYVPNMQQFIDDSNDARANKK